MTLVVIVPVNFKTWFLPLDKTPLENVKVAPVVAFNPTPAYPPIACSKISKLVFVNCPQVPEFSPVVWTVNFKLAEV